MALTITFIMLPFGIKDDAFRHFWHLKKKLGRRDVNKWLWRWHFFFLVQSKTDAIYDGLNKSQFSQCWSDPYIKFTSLKQRRNDELTPTFRPQITKIDDVWGKDTLKNWKNFNWFEHLMFTVSAQYPYLNF